MVPIDSVYSIYFLFAIKNAANISFIAASLKENHRQRLIGCGGHCFIECGAAIAP